MSTNNHIDYIEFKANDIEAVKTFYTACFNWVFTDYGPDYTSFSGSGVFGGFEKSDQPVENGALIVLYHEDLEVMQEKVAQAGGEVTVPVFSFPGGRRFHFKDPSGNELAVWSG
ncbi:VOC family protein [Robertkochia sediminum]|uniref:VOC family protein n=1 Tax=Robertkochia sediminum TaxID=2785326 RepID=UPI00193238D9|nr:VOC family protein [Robertkochia sediminum]MBL7471234.1 VOC family protein [Robertkochia sediminum]